MKRIPIFIITCDRLQVLKQSIHSYGLYLNYPIEIILVDQGTTFPDTISYINELKKNGIKVYRYPRARNISDVVPRLREVIEKWKRENKIDYYIVSDPDIAFHEKTPSDAIELYINLLNTIVCPVNHLKRWPVLLDATLHNSKHKQHDWLYPPEAVGPGLRIDDIPDYYPLKKKIMLWWQWMSDKSVARSTQTYHHKNENIHLSHNGIDTTWAIMPKTFIYKNMMRSVSVGWPYNCRHLDWYIDPEHPTEDQLYYAFNDKCFTYYSKGFEYNTKYGYHLAQEKK